MAYAEVFTALADPRVTVRFEARDGTTEIIVLHERISNPAMRDMHEQGWFGCLDGLVRLVEMD